MKLLIVEDNPQVRQLLKSLVADLVEVVAEYGDNAEAVADYAAEQMSDADWVLMDLRMPHVSELEATRRLVAADPAARVIIVAHDSDAFRREAARATGACGYVLRENLLDVRLLLRHRAS